MSYIKPGHSKGHKGTNQFIKALELGLDKPIVSNETRTKISMKSSKYRHSDETKRKISLSIRNAIIRNPESYNASNVNGRIQHYEINGFKIDGKWELDVANYLSQNNIKWVKPTTYFEYIWNNSTHKYFPDFYLPEYNRYIEVKGYERDRDKCKYLVVDNLIIITLKEINLIRNNKYDILSIIQSH